MRALTAQEHRTLRLGLAFIICYLLLFYGTRSVKYLERQRADYRRLVQSAQQLKRDLALYEKQQVALGELRERFQLDPSGTPRTELVAQASAAVRKISEAAGVQLGPVRESSARAAGRELASIQLEGAGPAAAVAALLYRLERSGYPLVIDSVQLTPEAAKPGTVKLNLTIVILDVEQWKGSEVRRV